MFLLKPHITGSEGQITSPDVIVDRLFVDGELQPVDQLTHQAWQQTTTGLNVHPAYAIMALGGGPIILPALTLSTGRVIVARAAWRLQQLDTHEASLTLNGSPLSGIGLPSELVESVGGRVDAMPRGYLLIRSADVAASRVLLEDPVKRRELELVLHEEPLAIDRWGGARPAARYSVGPTQKEVKHYL